MAVAQPTPQTTITPEVQEQLDRMQRQNDLLEVRIAFPNAPVDILEKISGDKAALMDTAKRLTEMATPPAPPAPAPAPPGTPPAPAVPANVPPAGGGAVPIPGPGQVTPPALQTNREYEEMKFKVENRTATDFERDAFFKAALRGDSGTEGWNPHIEKLKQRPGRS